MFLFRIWAFGPRRIGSNILVNRIDGYIRKSFFQIDKPAVDTQAGVTEDHMDEVLEVVADELSDQQGLNILDLDFHIHTGFQISTLAGPLCAEPLQGVCYIVQKVEIHDEGKSADGKTEQLPLFLSLFGALGSVRSVTNLPFFFSIY